MGDVINLNRFRKAKARVEKDAQAAGNRAKFGRTRVEKTQDRADVARRDAELDARRLEREGEDAPPADTGASDDAPRRD